jgi:anthranilate synthase/aminodeoxychorismate synthase-like glutamine amidotransferase
VVRPAALEPPRLPARPARRVLIIDNYDSFTYNTLHLLSVLGAQCTVLLNDRTSLEDIAARAPDGILLSAGPGVPAEAGITLDAIEHFAGSVPLLGVCLGHQAIACALGGRVVRATRMMHGKTCRVGHTGTGLFRGLPNPAVMARYNSLLVDEQTLPAVLAVTARSPEGEIMGFEHLGLSLQGVQFHPESVLSSGGDRLLRNWLQGLPGGAPESEAPIAPDVGNRSEDTWDRA